MITKLVLCFAIHYISVSAQDCTDLHGRSVSNGVHYIPGPDTCTLCVCDNGLPKVCKADCRSFRVGTTCCEFICLDDVVKPVEGVEGNLRVAAGGTACFVLLIIAFIVYKVRKQKRLNLPHGEDRRSLNSIGYISGSIGYMGSGCETAPGTWKPSGQYLPRGEAPPPYDEAIAQPEDALQCVGHGYVNVPRPIAQIANTQNCFNAPLLQQVIPVEARDHIVPHHLASNGL
ncbi:unnamed protein product [Leptidea sinapis]|uniref:VWFC domain-containing protein n=1 Tax=Leptidea sinapis TaxID=189913 RepID=A0A5E4QYV3_9NEOP|nr:unnamed protein product [Leptidea sinapis]